MDKEGFGSEEEIRDIAEKIWEQMMGFASYSFPKAHSSAYALLTNATQYLKVNYPIEFFCAYLQYVEHDEYGIVKNIASEKYNVKFINPDINESKEMLIIKDNKILWSLTSIKGIGVKAANEIVSKQPFDSFGDFYKRINKRIINVRIVNLLMTANAFRKFDKRNKILKQYSKPHNDIEYKIKSKNEWRLEANNIMSYLNKSVRQMFPNETRSVNTFEEFTDAKIGKRMIVAGIISMYKEINSKRGKMIIMKVDDSGNEFNMVCWNDFYNRLKENNITLKVGMAVRVSGTKNLSHREEEQLALGKESSSYIKVLSK